MGTVGGFSLLINSVQTAVKLNIMCEAHFVPMKCNYLEISETIELCENLGISKISFLRLVPHGRAKKNRNKILLDEVETAELKKRLYNISMKMQSIKVRIGTPLAGIECRHNCEAANGKLNIKYNGCVYPCEVFKNEDVVLLDGIKVDNIYIESLSKIYNSSLYLQKIRKLLLLYADFKDEENCIGQKFIRKEK